jgi:endonuclease YncB( thermonuclease family)
VKDRLIIAILLVALYMYATGTSVAQMVAITGAGIQRGIEILQPGVKRAISHGDATVDHVLDGDTILLADGRTVRLAQIDAPQLLKDPECGGLASRRALARQLPPGAKVEIQTDGLLGETDPRGRTLAYAIIQRGEREINLNLMLVKTGHAIPQYEQNVRGMYADELDAAKDDAKASKRGAWGACPLAKFNPASGFATGPVR